MLLALVREAYFFHSKWYLQRLGTHPRAENEGLWNVHPEMRPPNPLSKAQAYRKYRKERL